MTKSKFKVGDILESRYADNIAIAIILKVYEDREYMYDYLMLYNKEYPECISQIFDCASVEPSQYLKKVC